MNFKDISLARKIKFALAALVYLLVVIWIGNYWLLAGLAIVFDIYISRFIPWGSWKKGKDGKKPSALVEWIDEGLDALIANGTIDELKNTWLVADPDLPVITE